MGRKAKFKRIWSHVIQWIILYTSIQYESVHQVTEKWTKKRQLIKVIILTRNGVFWFGKGVLNEKKDRINIQIEMRELSQGGK